MAAKYATVYFSSEENGYQREFLNAMNGVKIIQLTKEEIDEHMKKYGEIQIGAYNHLVLHDEDEVKLFEHVMKVFFPEKEYKITDDPDDEEFAKWLGKKS